MTLAIGPGIFPQKTNLLEQTCDTTGSRSPTPIQQQVDQMVGGFVDQATDWKSLAAMMAGGLAFRLGKIGAMSVGAQNFVSLRRMISIGIGLGAEVSAFELTNRGLQNNPNPWKWSGAGGLKEGLLSSLVTFGTLKGLGALTQGQNLILQHLAQDTGMVLGHQITGALGITPKPEESLAEQFLHAEVTNLQIGAGMALGHGLTGGRLLVSERGLDLKLQSQESESATSPKIGQLPIATHPLLSPLWMFMGAGGLGGGSRKKDPKGKELWTALKADPDNLQLRQVYADWLLTQGDPRGELINLQLAADKTEEMKKREKEVTRQVIKSLCQKFKLKITNYEFKEGFLMAVKVMSPTEKSIRRFMEGETTLFLHKLALRDVKRWSTLAHLLSFPAIGKLTHLDLGYNGLHDEAIQSLAHTKYLSNLTHLDLRGNSFSWRPILALDQSEHLSKLTEVKLDDMSISEREAEGLNWRLRFSLDHTGDFVLPPEFNRNPTEPEDPSRGTGGGNLHAFTAPTLLGIDFFANGHPTTTGILVTGLATLASSGMVLGIFDWFGKKVGGLFRGSSSQEKIHEDSTVGEESHLSKEEIDFLALAAIRGDHRARQTLQDMKSKKGPEHRHVLSKIEEIDRLEKGDTGFFEKFIKEANVDRYVELARTNRQAIVALVILAAFGNRRAEEAIESKKINILDLIEEAQTDPNLRDVVEVLAGMGYPEAKRAARQWEDTNRHGLNTFAAPALLGMNAFPELPWSDLFAAGGTLAGTAALAYGAYRLFGWVRAKSTKSGLYQGTTIYGILHEGKEEVAVIEKLLQEAHEKGARSVGLEMPESILKDPTRRTVFKTYAHLAQKLGMKVIALEQEENFKRRTMIDVAKNLIDENGQYDREALALDIRGVKNDIDDIRYIALSSSAEERTELALELSDRRRVLKFLRSIEAFLKEIDYNPERHKTFWMETVLTKANQEMREAIERQTPDLVLMGRDHVEAMLGIPGYSFFDLDRGQPFVKGYETGWEDHLPHNLQKNPSPWKSKVEPPSLRTRYVGVSKELLEIGSVEGRLGPVEISLDILSTPSPISGPIPTELAHRLLNSFKSMVVGGDDLKDPPRGALAEDLMEGEKRDTLLASLDEAKTPRIVATMKADRTLLQVEVYNGKKLKRLFRDDAFLDFFEDEPPPSTERSPR